MRHTIRRNAENGVDRPEKPNVVLMLFDDLGWQDVKCYDIDNPSPVETPNMDKIAKEGVMFWRAYSPAPVCSPSRHSILNGKFPARNQRTHVCGGTPPVPYTNDWSFIEPWITNQMPLEEETIAMALQKNGYTTIHAGKWHVGDEKLIPQHGFDYTESTRGVTIIGGEHAHRLTGFATREEDDEYKLNDKGIPRDPMTERALEFMEKSKGDPFFLYYATWLVHAPIHTRSRELLQKYCDKLGQPFPTDPDGPAGNPGTQTNPYYLAMVEMLDSYVGQLYDYLTHTDDPRWPGHKLIENTYVILNSDNGGMLGHDDQHYTSNLPLAEGKIDAKEGGIRVPLMILGPGIPRNVQSDVMVNGVDFYPTILSWTNTNVAPEIKNALDGVDLSSLLSTDPTDPQMIREKDGSIRDTMVWHFPNSYAQQTTIIKGNYKYIYNLKYPMAHKEGDEEAVPFELYKLYSKPFGPNTSRVDIEEMVNIADQEPERAKAMHKELFDRLAEMNATLSYRNPRYEGELELPDKEKIPVVTEEGKHGRDVWARYEENGAKVVKANVMYAINGGTRDEYWIRIPAEVDAENRLVKANLPERATHYAFNLIDENNFLVSFPYFGEHFGLADDESMKLEGKTIFSRKALSVE